MKNIKYIFIVIIGALICIPAIASIAWWLFGAVLLIYGIVGIIKNSVEKNKR
jgi:hypothetical protein